MFRLSDFDQQVIQKWRITTRDLENVQRYVAKLQKHLTHSSLDDIAVGGIYGTRALLHEVVELRILLERDPDLLRRSHAEVVTFFEANRDAHLAGLTEEYLYLWRQVHRHFNVWCNIGALVWANSPLVFEELFETDLPFHYPNEAEVRQAEEWLASFKRRRQR